MRTQETRDVEELLRPEFQQVDAYRYNSASIRVRVVDRRFSGKDTGKRDAMVEPFLKDLPERTQADIMMLLTLSPEEIEQRERHLREWLLNAEFEDPTRSAL
jgi:hypothetical protein